MKIPEPQLSLWPIFFKTTGRTVGRAEPLIFFLPTEKCNLLTTTRNGIFHHPLICCSHSPHHMLTQVSCTQLLFLSHNTELCSLVVISFVSTIALTVMGMKCRGAAPLAHAHFPFLSTLFVRHACHLNLARPDTLRPPQIPSSRACTWQDVPLSVLP